MAEQAEDIQVLSVGSDMKETGPNYKMSKEEEEEEEKSFCQGCFTPVGLCVLYTKEEEAEDFLTVCPTEPLTLPDLGHIRLR